MNKKSLLIGIIVSTAVVSFATSCSCHPTNYKELLRIEIAHPVNKTEYVVGDAFSLEGLEVHSIYLNEEYTITDYASSLEEGYVFVDSDIGPKQVTITYQEKTADFVVRIKQKESPVPEKELVDIELTSLPEKLEYVVGEEFDPTGLEVTAIYDDESTEVVTDYQITDVDTSVSGTKLVIVSYQGLTAEFNVEVKNKEVVTLKSIKVTNKPDKLTYYVDDEFDPTGLEVTATYSDSSTKVVTESCTLSNPNMSSIGVKSITVKYTEGGITKSATFSIKVEPKPHLTDITITKLPINQIYYIKEEFDPTGMEITATYSDGREAVISSNDENLSYSYNFDDPSQKSGVIVIYKEGSYTCQDNFNVEVVDRTHIDKKIMYEISVKNDGYEQIDSETFSLTRLDSVLNPNIYFKTSGYTYLGTDTVTLAPGGYISLYYVDSETNTLPNIRYVSFIGQEEQNITIHTGYVNKEVGSDELFVESDVFAAKANQSWFSLEELRPSYIAFTNDTDSDIHFTDIRIAYDSGKHRYDPYKGGSHYSFVSGVTHFVNGEERAKPSGDAYWHYKDAIDEYNKSAEFTYRQGNMVWDDNGYVNEPKPFKISVDVFVLADYADYYKVDPYLIVDGEKVITNVTLRYQYEISFLGMSHFGSDYYQFHVDATGVSTWHAGGPFLYVEIYVTGSSVSASEYENLCTFQVTTSAIDYRYY